MYGLVQIMNSNPWDLDENISQLIRFRHERDWEKFHRPKELATALSIEAGELQELFLWREEENAKDITSDHNLMTRIKEEVADIAIYLLYLSCDLGINLREAIQNKLTLNEDKYPVEKYKGVLERHMNTRDDD